MEDAKKREAIINYFKSAPKIPTKILSICIICAFILYASEFEIEAYGLWASVILILIIWMYNLWRFQHRPRPTDDEFDQWLNDDINILSKQILDKVGIDQSEIVGEPISIIAPRIYNRAGTSLLYKKGEDDYLRYTPINVTLIHFTEHQLLSYQAIFDLTTGKTLSPRTDEFFYNDIISVSTAIESHTVKTDNGAEIQYNQAETFKLVTSGGTSLQVILKDPKLIAELGGSGELPQTRSEKAVQIIRRMLRDKKSK